MDIEIPLECTNEDTEEIDYINALSVISNTLIEKLNIIFPCILYYDITSINGYKIEVLNLQDTNLCFKDN